jgi:membrane complex biogenesis BtpA family protein
MRVIGMLHLPPLPGAPRYGGDLGAVRDAMLRDAESLAAGGVHGLMLENFGDVPFYPGRVAAHVVAHMTAIAVEVRRRVPGLPLGVNVLRNDGRSALAVAHAAGAKFIRVNVLCGARVTDQGILQGIAHDLLRDRKALGAEDVRVFADVDVKHSAPLGPARSLADEVADTVHRGLADAVIVSGSGTGRATDPAHVREVKEAAGGKVPVYVGSGVTAETVRDLLPHADGFIVGTAFKRGRVAGEAVEVGRVREFVARVEERA